MDTMTGARKKLPSTAVRTVDPSFPCLGPGKKAQIKNDYENLQQEELVALESIYGDDFVNITEAHGAWKKSVPAFEIFIREAIGESNDNLSLKLRVGFTATYPKTQPALSIHNCQGVPDSTQFKIQTLIDNKPQTLVNLNEPQGIIFDLVEQIREVLQDASQDIAKGMALPSLEEERENHRTELERLAHNQEKEEERKRIEAVKEEDRMMSDMVGAELERQRQMGKESKPKTKSWPASESSRRQQQGYVQFDRLCKAADRSGNTLTFTAVTAKDEFSVGPVSTVFTVLPVLEESHSRPPVLILKETVLRVKNKDPKEVKKQIRALESSLEDIKIKLTSNKNILQVFEFKIDSNLSQSTVPLLTISILSPLADTGSLGKLLRSFTTPQISMVRDWTRDLLDALNFIHGCQIVHQSIHPGNILLTTESTGELVPKLTDVSYQRQLHIINSQARGLPGIGSARATGWLPPEIAESSNPQYTYKSDVWDFGVVFLQMIFGLDVVTRFKSPDEVKRNMALSPQLHELVSRFFRLDPQKRSRPFELSSSEFLATDAPVEIDPTSILSSSLSIPNQHLNPSTSTIVRRESSNKGVGFNMSPFTNNSRYETDYTEEGRLGKGGFGEVVKARSKIDARLYAVKKITQKSKDSLTEVLKEIKLLAGLDHPAVVRYYHAWVEEQLINEDSSGSESEESDEDEESSSGARIHAKEEASGIPFEFCISTGAKLDFMSSNHEVHMSDESEDDEDGSDEDEDDEDDDNLDERGGTYFVGSPNLKAAPRYKTTLYIAMEYCEKRTLRDLIMARTLSHDTPQIWRLFRQILEGVAHIHSLGIVHRDMKPDNIFLSRGSDGLEQVKIGDFGLATSGQFASDKKPGPASTAATSGNAYRFTSNVGTFMYCAPEMFSVGGGTYGAKVDMYSLGIILFEMCYHPIVGMERADVLQHLRADELTFPSDFRPLDKALIEIITSLLVKSPKERPSSTELLAGGKLPVQMESEQMRRALAGLADPASPYNPKVISALFSNPITAAKNYAFDMSSANLPSAAELTNCHAVKNTLISVFRRHGALEIQRSPIYPKSQHYIDGEEVVQLLDNSGNVLQLPYDLTLGHARMLAKATGSVIERSYTFGNVFRDKKNTSQPRMIGEVDFDIVGTDTLDLTLKEAEVLKVLDEIILELPSMKSGQMCFMIGHSDLLQRIFEFCGISLDKRKKTASIISGLNVHNFTWVKALAELRSSSVGLSKTSVDELERFDFRDSPSKAFAKLKTIFEGTDVVQQTAPIFAHLKEVAEYAKRMKVTTKIFINPLTSFRESFYNGGILFTCQYDRKGKEVFAAGGRYDNLIRDHNLTKTIGVGGDGERHAVGFSLAWEKVARIQNTGSSNKKKSDGDATFAEKRCDVLLASFNSETLRSTGIDLLSTLWGQNISAQLARDARTPEELLAQQRDEQYSWIVIIKETSVKVKQMANREAPDMDVPLPQLVSWIRQEMKERDYKSGAKLRAQHETSGGSSAITAGSGERGENGRPRVTMLVAQNKSKKFNRQAAVEQAEASTLNLLQMYAEGDVISTELSERTIDAIRRTAGVGDAEGWKRVEAGAPVIERKYVREALELLTELSQKQQEKGMTGPPGAVLHNFRSGSCSIYQF